MDTEQQRLVAAINEFEWTHWGTLTTRWALPPEQVQARYENWICRLNGSNGRKVNHIFVVEHSPSGRAHVHFQLGNVSIPTEKMKALWITSGGTGVNQIESYDASKGSAYTLKDWLTSEYHGADFKGLAPTTKGPQL